MRFIRPVEKQTIQQESNSAMIISLDENTRIFATDGLNFTLQRRSVIAETNPISGAATKNAGQVRWDAVGYHGSLLQSALSALQKKLCTGDTEVSLRELMVEIRDASNEIAKACRVAPEALKSRVLPEDLETLTQMIERAAAAPLARRV